MAKAKKTVKSKKPATNPSIKRVKELESRVKDLEFGMEAAIAYIEDLMGSDGEDSPTLNQLRRILND